VLGEDAYPTVHVKAAAMLRSLARNHPFIDGNKRTAWAAASVFYEINGFEIVADDGLIIGLVVEFAEGLKGVQDIAKTVKAWAQPFPIDDDWMGTSLVPTLPAPGTSRPIGKSRGNVWAPPEVA
jgi:death on curing protein